MTRESRRIQLALGYILHHRPYRDTSRILEAYTREHGRITVFARGVRGPKAKLAALLQPFRPLLLSWSGRGEAVQLTAAEAAEAVAPLPSGSLLAAFYASELLLKLTTSHDPLPAAFDVYDELLAKLRGAAPLEPALRIFEKRLLEALGYGVELATVAHTGERVVPGAYYHFRPQQGLVLSVRDAQGALAGESLLSLQSERLKGERELEDSRRVLQAALAQCLEGRPLATRTVAKSLARLELAARSRLAGHS